MLQEWKHPLPLRRFGRWFSVRVETTTGQMRLLGVQVDCLPERNVTHARG
jgi:predicted phage tail protein